MPTARLNPVAYRLELLSCARKLRDRKPSLFYAFEIFAHTGVCHFRTFDLVPAHLSVLIYLGFSSDCLSARLWGVRAGIPAELRKRSAGKPSLNQPSTACFPLRCTKSATIRCAQMYAFSVFSRVSPCFQICSICSTVSNDGGASGTVGLDR